MVTNSRLIVLLPLIFGLMRVIGTIFNVRTSQNTLKRENSKNDTTRNQEHVGSNLLALGKTGKKGFKGAKKPKNFARS